MIQRNNKKNLWFEKHYSPEITEIQLDFIYRSPINDYIYL